MNCNEVRRLLEADADGELDLVRHLEVQEHVRSCAACGEVAAAVQLRRNALRTTLPRFTAPIGLADSIRAAVQAEAPVAHMKEVPAGGARPSRAVIVPFWQLTSLAASVAIALTAGYSWGTHRADRNALLEEVIADHVRSLQVDHLTDVASTNQHTVKPWFAGKLDFSPPVVDLAPVGFELTGGRLEHIANGPAAALVFHRRQHAINLFIWPSQRGAVPAVIGEHNGFHVATWTQGDLRFLAISDIPADEVAQFAAGFRKATGG